jgi:hypothetical protein
MSISRIAYSHVNTRQPLAILRISIPIYHICFLFVNRSTNEYAYHVLLSILFQLFKPFWNAFICGSSGKVKYN